ncbi:MAG: hypothetical protein QXL94_07020 [Candidatus Parvarchaeum sp.]
MEFPKSSMLLIGFMALIIIISLALAVLPASSASHHAPSNIIAIKPNNTNTTHTAPALPPANTIAPITPSNTIAPSKTKTPSNTITPANTIIPTNTINPSNTITPQPTPIPNVLPISEITTYLIIPRATSNNLVGATYIPVESTNTTTITYICTYMPYTYQNPQYNYGNIGKNFSDPYTLKGQMEEATLGKSIAASSPSPPWLTGFCN